LKGFSIEGREVGLPLVEFEHTSGGIVEGFSEGIIKILALLWKTATSLSHREHHFAVVCWSDQELWVGSISLLDVLLVDVWQAARV
jgi:hypothetical protein